MTHSKHSYKDSQDLNEMTAAASPSVMMIETNEREDNFDHLLDSQQYSKDEVNDDQTFAHLDGVQIKTNDD